MTTEQLVVDELATPFDDLDSPTTVATPSCCCCCCCCIVTVGATAMLAGLTVGNDLRQNDDGPVGDDRRMVLAGVAAAVPILSLVVGLVLLANLGDQSDGDGPGVGLLIGSLGVGAGIFAWLRIRAGCRADQAIGNTMISLVVIAAAILAELFLTLVTAFIFWLAAPLWWWLIWRFWHRRVEGS